MYDGTVAIADHISIEGQGSTKPAEVDSLELPYFCELLPEIGYH